MKYKYRLNILFNEIFSCFMFGNYILLQYICIIKISQNNIQQWQHRNTTKAKS